MSIFAVRARRASALVVLLCACAASSAAAAPTFGTASTYPAGTYPSDVATGDFNRDGKADVVVPNTETGALSVLSGVGNGTLGTPTSVAASGYPSAVAVADFNADGKQDVAYADLAADAVEIVLGNGDGTFQPRSLPYPVGTNPQGIATRDIDGDGLPDLATADSGSNGVSVLLNQGAGVFGTASSYAVGSGVYSVALAQGMFATANSSDDTATVNFAGVGAHYPVGTTPSWVGIADLDGDGNADVVTANRNSGDVSVLRGKGSNTFAPAVSYPAGDSAAGGALANLDFDGHPDLVTANVLTSTVSVLGGNGDGSFGAPTTIGVGTSPVAVATADLDNDGLRDVIVANADANTVSVLRNRTPAPAPAAGAPTANLMLSTGHSRTNPFVYPQYSSTTVTYSCGPGQNGAAITKCEGTNGTPSGATIKFPFIGPGAFTATATAADGQTGTDTIRYTVAAPPSIALSGVTAGKVYAKGSPLTLAFSCASGQYGLGIEECFGFDGRDPNRTGKKSLPTGDLGDFSYEVRAYSNEGGTTIKTIKYKVAEPPTVDIVSPYENQVLNKGDVEQLRYSCAPGKLSGALTSCTATQTGSQLDTATVGDKTLTVTATTESGLSTMKTVHYSVNRCTTTITTAGGAIRVEALYPACVMDAGDGYWWDGFWTINGDFTINGLPFSGRVTVAEEGTRLAYPRPYSRDITRRPALTLERGSSYGNPVESVMHLCLAEPSRSGSCPLPMDVPMDYAVLGYGGFDIGSRNGDAIELAPVTFDFDPRYQALKLLGMPINTITLGFGRDKDGERYTKVGSAIALPYPFSATPNVTAVAGDRGARWASQSVPNPVRIPIGVRYDRTGAHVDANWAATGSTGLRLTASEAYLGTIPVKNVCFSPSSATGAQACPGPSSGSARNDSTVCHPGDAVATPPADAWRGGVDVALPRMPSGSTIHLYGSVADNRIVRLSGTSTAVTLGSDISLGTAGLVLCPDATQADYDAGRGPVSLRGSLSGATIKGFTLARDKLTYAFDDRWTLNGAEHPWRGEIGTPSFGFKGITFSNARLGVNASDQIDAAADVSKDVVPGVLSVNGYVGGWLDYHKVKFSFGGGGGACVSGLGCHHIGDFVVSSKGLGVCFNLSTNWGLFTISWHPGIGVTWDPFDFDVMWKSCGLGDYQEARPTRRRAAGAAYPVAVPAGQKVLAIHATGATAPPKLAVTAPDGSTPSGDGYYEVENPARNTTTVLVLAPEQGTWTVASADGATPIVKVETARDAPLATATGTVTGKGQRRTLHLVYTKDDSEHVELVERGRSYGRTIVRDVQGAPCAGGRVSSEGAPLLCATVPFRPRLGATGTRSIQAIVSDAAGVEQRMLHVADFKVTAFPRPARPGHLRLRRAAKHRLVATWHGVAGASTYVATIALGDGRRLARTVSAKRRSLVIGHVTRNVAARVTLRGVRSDQVMGRPASARVAPARDVVLRTRYTPAFGAFGSGRWALRSRERAWLLRLLPALRGVHSILCEGHSSPWDGHDEQWLAAVAERRARIVCAYLTRHGYRGLTAATGRADSRPRTGNATLRGQQRNGRVTIVAQRVARRQ